LQIGGDNKDSNLSLKKDEAGKINYNKISIRSSKKNESSQNLISDT
jgi:hypothetical protein